MLYLTGSRGEDAKDMPSLGVNVDDAGEAASLYVLGRHITAASMNSADGGTLSFCFFFLRYKIIVAQTMRSRAAPVTPIAIAVTFNDLPGEGSGEGSASEGAARDRFREPWETVGLCRVQQAPMRSS